MVNNFKQWLNSIFIYADLRANVKKYHREKKVPKDVMDQLSEVKSRIFLFCAGLFVLYFLISELLDLL